jgi:hypothetical protein
MHEILRDRILRRLEALPEDRLYQVLDHIEFLESKYAQRAAPSPNVLQRLAEGVEDTLRAGNISASTVAEAMGFMSKAIGVLGGVASAGASVASGVAAAGASVANDLVGGTKPKAEPVVPDASVPPAKKPSGQ